jgi:hypothetical protein
MFWMIRFGGGGLLLGLWRLLLWGLFWGRWFRGVWWRLVGSWYFGELFCFLVRLDEREVRRVLLMRALQVWINFRWNLRRSTCVVPTGDIWSGSVESQSEEDA